MAGGDMWDLAMQRRETFAHRWSWRNKSGDVLDAESVRNLPDEAVVVVMFDDRPAGEFAVGDLRSR